MRANGSTLSPDDDTHECTPPTNPESLRDSKLKPALKESAQSKHAFKVRGTDRSPQTGRMNARKSRLQAVASPQAVVIYYRSDTLTYRCAATGAASEDGMKLSERDICSKYITPALVAAGWDLQSQIREELSFTKGRVIVRGKLHARGQAKRADYVLFARPNQPVALIEAKDASHAVGAGMQQALDYADALDVPFVFSSNGSGFLLHDRSGTYEHTETELALSDFPSPEELWQRYCRWKGLDDVARVAVDAPYYDDGSGRSPRYYQANAINRAVEAVARGQQRILLVMATGTGKTYTAFQIIWRLWKSHLKKRILFLADRDALITQTRNGDFSPFGSAMTRIQKRQADKAFEIYLSLYQAVTGAEEEQNIYKQFSPDFFDLIVIDECHRGSAAEDSAWREILDYFSSATHVGLTATPKETREVSNIHYFGEPVYSYTLRQGIDDGFLAPYKVVRIDIDRDLQGWRPAKGQTDKHGELIEDRIYNQKDFDRTLVLEARTELVARTITRFLEATDPYAKTIVFCEDIDHAERMRQALVNLNPTRVRENRKYIMRITGDEKEGKSELENFCTPESRYPVIATTSKLMTTGVDAQTCKLVVLDQRIQSMTEFKQIIGRGTRINEDYDKYWFTIMDFKKATELFADPAFDGDPVQVYEPGPGDSPVPPEDEPPPGVEVSGDAGEGGSTGLSDDEERADQVRKRDVFARYGEQARAVLDALLDKYADAGIASIEDIKILTLDPFNRIGTPGEIIGAFGDKTAYLAAVHALEDELYRMG